MLDEICSYLRLPFTPPVVERIGEPEQPDEAATRTAGTEERSRNTEREVRLIAQEILLRRLRHRGKKDRRPLWDHDRINLRNAHLDEINLMACSLTNVDFSGSTFTGRVRFEGAIFIGDADFWDATLTREGWFMDATFFSVAGFEDATFNERAVFEGVTFNGDANFSGATFTGDADSIRARLGQHIPTNQAPKGWLVQENPDKEWPWKLTPKGPEADPPDAEPDSV